MIEIAALILSIIVITTISYVIGFRNGFKAGMKKMLMDGINVPPFLPKKQ